MLPYPELSISNLERVIANNVSLIASPGPIPRRWRRRNSQLALF